MLLLGLAVHALTKKKEPPQQIFDLSEALITFHQAVKETFPLGRQRIEAMNELGMVNADGIKKLLTQYDLPMPYEAGARTWPPYAALKGMEAILRHKPTLVTEAAVTTALDNILTCPGKQHHINAVLSPENDPYPYVANLWSFLNLAATAKPQVFRSSEIKQKLLQAYTDESALRPATASLCLTNLYFENELLSPREYLAAVIQGVTHDAPLLQADKLGGRALLHLSNYMERAVTHLSPVACVQKSSLISDLNDNDINTLRTLHNSTEDISPNVHTDLNRSILSLLQKRPDLAEETDLDLINLKLAAEQGCDSIKDLHLNLSAAASLAKVHPDWDWQDLNRDACKIQTRLQNPISREQNAAMDNGIALIEWRSSDLIALRAVQNFCDAFVANTREPTLPAPPTALSANTPQTGLGTKS